MAEENKLFINMRHGHELQRRVFAAQADGFVRPKLWPVSEEMVGQKFDV